MPRILLSAAFFALVGLAGAALAKPAALLTPTATTSQLPRNVRPSHYAVSITPDKAASRFAAHVVITIDVLAPTSTITLNAAELTFNSASLLAANAGTAPDPAQISLDADNETATFTFRHPIGRGKYRLALDYTGLIGTQAAGLFSLDYDTDGVSQRALYTQFENSDARRVIASWDEPVYKATFALEVNVPANEVAVSNMPIEQSTPQPDGRKLVRFAQSPKMSTYLLFYGQGKFERASVRVGGTELGVITKPGVLTQSQFSLDASAAVLREYNDYFGLPFPLPKLDNIAAPGRSQFFGAMENWGAIFTFEYGLLLDPAISTQLDKERIFRVAAHEIAHQWFGDLVTMQWWDDLWLNEGFASWMESRTTALLHPEWHTALGLVDTRERAMSLDALDSTHAVVQHVATAAQASQAFDAITYNKGEAVIRMLENHVGAEAWRAGVRAYMKRHAYGNTVSDDLWRALEQATGKPIMAIAHDFTLQPGVPMIRVADVSCKAGNSIITLTQAEFSRSQPDKKALTWRVPVTLQIGASGPPVHVLVRNQKAVVRAPGCGAVLVNAGQTGYYRTLYGAPNFAELVAKFGALPPVDQLGLLADTAQLGLAGLQPLSDFLALVAATPLSAEPKVWSEIAELFASMDRYYAGDTMRQGRFRRFALARLTPIMTQLGWIAKEGEPDAIAPIREQLVLAMSALDDQPTIAEARRRFASNDSGTAALRKMTLSVLAEHADRATWETLRRAAQTETSTVVKVQLYDLLAASKDDTLARQALALALTDEPGLTTSAGMIRRVADYHPDLAFDFAVAHRARIDLLVDITSRSRFFPALAVNSADPAMRKKLLAYADAYLTHDARRELDISVAKITDRIRVQDAPLRSIDRWLDHNPG